MAVQRHAFAVADLPEAILQHRQAPRRFARTKYKGRRGIFNVDHFSSRGLGAGWRLRLPDLTDLLCS